MSEPNGLNQEIWNQNFEALKSSYLKVMNKNKSKTNGFNNYNFRDSADTFNSAAKPPKQKQPIKPSAPHAMSENEYEKFRQTFKDEEEQNQESISDSDNIDNINVGMTATAEVKEVSMDKPKYGNVNQSITRLDDKLAKTNSNDKSLDINAESFNWEDEEVKQDDKINLAQYENEDDNYDDDFEEPVPSNDNTPHKMEELSPKQKEQSPSEMKKPQAEFTNEEQDIIDNYDILDEDTKLITKQKQALSKHKVKDRTFESKDSNRINEYLTRKNQKGTFNVDEILASRMKTFEQSPKPVVIDPFSKMKQSNNKQHLLKSYKEAREDRQKQNIQKQIDQKINSYDSATIEKLANLMNMFEIGESMPMDQDLQQIPEVNEPRQTQNIKPYNYEPETPEDAFERSNGTNEENPFTKQSNFLAFHASSEANPKDLTKEVNEDNKKASTLDRYQLPEDDEEDFKDESDYQFPLYMQSKDIKRGDSILRPLSAKQSERYSKCDK